MVENIKHIFVIDSSYVLSFLLKENNSEVNVLMKQFEARQIELISTILLKYEVGNTLKTSVLRKRTSKLNAQKLFETFLDFDIAEEMIDYVQVLKLAFEKKLSFYDASYLYLAKSKEIKLLTLDHSLK